MANILHQVGITADLSDAVRAVTSTKGISQWWVPASGNASVGNIIDLHFGEHLMQMEVLGNEELNIQWRCVSGDEQWKNTLLRFDFIPTDNQLLLNFSHSQWAHETELFRHCNTKWAVFMLSLKEYLETGTGRPYPEDTQINYY